MGRRTRSPLRRIVALTLVAAIAAACGGNDPSASTAATQPAGPASSAGSEETTVQTDAPVFTNAPTTTDPALVPVSGGSIVVGIEGDSSGYNPTVDPWANGGHNVAKAIFDTLATFDATGKVVPYLAEAITANDDASVWTISLRPGVMFHDGTPLTADAVRLNFEAVQASASFKDQLALLESMTVVDDLTLELTMSAPWGTFPNSLTGTIGAGGLHRYAGHWLAAVVGTRRSAPARSSSSSGCPTTISPSPVTTTTGRPPRTWTRSPSSRSLTPPAARPRSTPVTSTSTTAAVPARSRATWPSRRPGSSVSPSALPVNLTC